MARDFDEAEHPRWLRGSGDRSGEFRAATGAVSTAVSWAERISEEARARRKFRYAQPGELLPDHYEPGQWVAVTRDYRVAQLMESMRPETARIFPDFTQEQQDEITRRAAQDALIDVGTILRNGPNVITVKASAGRVDVNVLIDEVDQLLVEHPIRNPLNLGVRAPHEMFGAGALGETLSGTGTMWLSSAVFERHMAVGAAAAASRPGHFMPTAQTVTGLRYYLSHEWGHAVDPSGTVVTGAYIRAMAINNRKGGRLLSTYGQKLDAEAFAEAFAEWRNTRGKSNNPIVRMYAREFGWRRP